MRVIGRRYDQGQPVSLDVLDGVIANIETWRCADKALLPWIAPGLVDLQVNGYGGQEFTDVRLTAEAVERISTALDCAGVTTYLPTVTTQSHNVQLQAVRTIATAWETYPTVRQRVAGIHLEGPYISPEDGPRGAHPREHCRSPDWAEFCRLQEAAHGLIRIITLSPEFPGAPEFIRQTAESGVVVSIGHTNANSQQLQAAVDAGARLSTHLGNGAHAFIHRHPNYVWDQLADDRLTATIIADGLHLPPAVVKSLVRGKTPERIVLISDITALAGHVPGQPGLHQNTSLGDVEILDDGRVVVAGQPEYLAGATRPLHTGVINVMKFADVDLAAAVDMASAHPAAVLGLPARQLSPGDPADLILFDMPEDEPCIEIVATIKAGECVYEKQRE